VTVCPARANPFRVERLSRLRYRLDEEGWTALRERLRGLGHRGALVGPHGSGKSTLLAELEERLEAEGWRIRRLRLNSDSGRSQAAEWRELLRNAGPADLLSIDGAEQLGPLTWWRVCRASRRLGGLIVTTHRPGRLPTLHEHRTDPGLLQALVQELVGAETARDSAAELEREFRRQRGNLRDCLRALYDRTATGP
jgi:hypothetical protein